MFRLYLTVFMAVLLSSPLYAVSTVPVTIESGGQRHLFHLEVANTSEEQERGLMYRTELPADGGMLFPYAPPRPIYMWMRNTLIPLDMIFVRPKGVIGYIEHDAEPHSEIPRGTPSDVQAVLELPGGTARRLGIKVGDYVDYTVPENK
jgi:uncharacterized membrane protein (UPF0127 family)